MQASPNKQSTANQALASPLPGHRRALSMLVLAYTLSITDRMILSILFPDIKAEFGVSDTQLGLLGGLSFPCSTPRLASRSPGSRTSTTANGLSRPVSPCSR